MVVTSKGNYGKVISVGNSTAMVKMGYKVHEIELYLLIDVTNGLHLKVTYESEDKEDVGLVFIKHGTLLWDAFDPRTTEILLKVVKDNLIKKLNNTNIKILKVNIP